VATTCNFRACAHASTDTLFVLADNRTPVDGKAVKGFEIAGHFLVRNRFAITANFEDGLSGVYLATIPAEGFTRMGTPEALRLQRLRFCSFQGKGDLGGVDTGLADVFRREAGGRSGLG